jgi:hypothetical protein
VKFIDPDGRSVESTGVRKNKDGSYTVVNARNDGDNGVYIADSNGNYDINTSQRIAYTKNAWDFMGTNDTTGEFEGNSNVTFDLRNLTVSGSIKLPDGSTASVNKADVNKLLSWGRDVFRNEVEKESSWTFYGELKVLRNLSKNNGPLDLKVSLGVDKYTALKYGEASDGLPIISSLRGVSNVLFGHNMRTTKPFFTTEFGYYNTVMREVGKYNQSQNSGQGYNKGFPYYGEHTYSGQHIYEGYFNEY